MALSKLEGRGVYLDPPSLSLCDSKGMAELFLNAIMFDQKTIIAFFSL